MTHGLQTGKMKMSFGAKVINVEEYVLVRYDDEFTLGEFEESAASTRKLLDEHRWKRLLLDLRGVTSRVPVADIYFIIELGKTLFPFVKIGVVFPPGGEEYGRFADDVAANRGMKLKSFVDYEQAAAWLTGETT